MNSAPVLTLEYSLLDQIGFMSITGKMGLIISVLLVVGGIVLAIRRPSLRMCRVFTLAAFMPILHGLADSLHSMMSAFATLGSSGLGDPSKLFAALAEIAVPFQFGIFGSALGLFSAAMIWMCACDDAPLRP